MARRRASRTQASASTKETNRNKIQEISGAPLTEQTIVVVALFPFAAAAGWQKKPFERVAPTLRASFWKKPSTRRAFGPSFKPRGSVYSRFPDYPSVPKPPAPPCPPSPPFNLRRCSPNLWPSGRRKAACGTNPPGGRRPSFAIANGKRTLRECRRSQISVVRYLERF